MTKHITGEELTNYADKQLDAAARAQADTHLSACNDCVRELEHVLEIKVRLSRLPHRMAPAGLLHRLHEQHSRPTFWQRTRTYLSRPWAWRSLGAMAFGSLMLGVWFWGYDVQDDAIDLDPLLAAHSRYQEETLARPSDLSRERFSAQLANFYRNDE